VQVVVLFLFAFFLFYYGKVVDSSVNEYKKGENNPAIKIEVRS